MDKKSFNKEKRIDDIHSSLHKAIDAKADLDKSVVNFVHTSIKETMDEEGNFNIFNAFSSALNMQTKMFNNLKSNFEKMTETADKEKTHS